MDKIKLLVVTFIAVAVILFGVLIMNVNSHEINYNHHGGYHHGYQDMGPDYCPGHYRHYRWVPDNYDKLLEKQEQERQEFLKNEEAKWRKNVEKGGTQK